MKRTLPTNTYLKMLIGNLKKYAIETKKPLWKRIAIDLEKPTRKRREVNLNSINRVTKENEIIIIPGKVLGNGNLNHKLTIIAWKFSKQALLKIKQSNSKAVNLEEFLKTKPSNKNIRIIG